MKKLIFLALLFSTHSQALINGKRVAQGKLPFVVDIGGGCGATKVGPRHFITAAHCLYTGPEEKRETVFFVPYNFKTISKVWMDGTTYIHPSWKQFRNVCKHCQGFDLPENDLYTKSDVALFVADKETPEIPWIDIYFKPLPTDGSTKVTLTGYGCQEGIYDPHDDPGILSNLRYQESTLQPKKILRHQGSSYKDYITEAGGSNWITKGHLMDQTSASLCPGDSGSPLLIKRNGKWMVIGVAHNYTYNDAESEHVSMTNLHSRIDDQSYNKVGEWIRSKW